VITILIVGKLMVGGLVFVVDCVIVS
jgi:hypothetical protein